MRKLFKWKGILFCVLVAAGGGIALYLYLNMPPTWGAEPSWSPDGRFIAFAADPLEGEGPAEIFISTVDGEHLKQITFDEHKDHYPTWSPPGTQLAYTSKRAGQWYLCLMHATGADQRCLVPLRTGYPTRPSWSPDGARLAVAAHRNGATDIYSVGVDDTLLTNLTAHRADDDQPAWSPDGSKIVFSSKRRGAWDLYVMDADGSNPYAFLPPGGRNNMAHWLPDTTQAKLTFVSNRNGNNDVYVWDFLSGDLKQWTDGPDRHFYPMWSPDGRSLAFMLTSFSIESTGIYIQDEPNGTPTLLTRR